jgi:c-di-GMP-binding flagellar brake protein YcgR
MNSIKYPTAIDTEKKEVRPHPQKGVFAIERRKHTRFTIQFPLHYSLVGGKAVYETGMTVDASEGGLLVYLPEAIAIGAVLKIEIFYVNNSGLAKIKAIAKVVWSNVAFEQSLDEYRYGMEFQSIDQRNAQELKLLLKKSSETHDPFKPTS